MHIDRRIWLPWEQPREQHDHELSDKKKLPPLDRASCTLTSGPTIFAAESTPRDLGFEDGLQLDIQYESELMQLP